MCGLGTILHAADHSSRWGVKQEEEAIRLSKMSNETKALVSINN